MLKNAVIRMIEILNTKSTLSNIKISHLSKL